MFINKAIYKEIPWLEPSIAVSAFTGDDYTCMLHSTLPNVADDKLRYLGRYSFIASNPFSKITAKDGNIFINDIQVNKIPYDMNPFDVLGNFMKDYKLEPDNFLPPLQGGAMGWFGYELGMYIEDIPQCTNPLSEYGDMAVGVYDWVLSFDHHMKKVFIIACGFKDDANTVIAEVEGKLKMAVEPDLVQPKINGKIKTFFTKEEYKQAVQKIINYIYAGDVFQVNMTQPFQVSYKDASPLQVYQYLSHINPAPFSAYMDCGNVVISSSSPERFITMDAQGLVETRPIKGTCPRCENIELDKQLSDELLASVKDRAENVMIVDLMRNDISKVCRGGTISVPVICGLESYQSVHHLVSVVRGVVNSDVSACDVLKACFPGGSITGAPKIRSQEIIAKLENRKRSVYCGAIGYIGFDGSMDTNIAIRTMSIKDGVATFNAGGGIVSDSDTESEYEETLFKVRKMLQVFGCDIGDLQ